MYQFMLQNQTNLKLFKHSTLKAMNVKEKKRFEEMAERDKVRFEHDMQSYQPAPGEKMPKRKRTKDPNAPKRSL